MPPPVRTSSEICKRLLITSNFEDTFEPPTIERVGDSCESVAFFNARVSFSNKNPAHDEWAA